MSTRAPRRDKSPLLIQGNFTPAHSNRGLRCVTRLLAVVLFLFVIGALSLYGYKVHFKGEMNQLAKQTRELNEENRELLVQLNRVRSFQNVENAAKRVPHLKLSETVIEVPAQATVHLPDKPQPQQELPRVYGY